MLQTRGRGASSALCPGPSVSAGRKCPWRSRGIGEPSRPGPASCTLSSRRPGRGQALSRRARRAPPPAYSAASLRRPGGLLPGALQHHAFPVLQPRRHLLLRQPQRQVLLAVHHRPAAHDARGRGGYPAVHQPLLCVRGPGRRHRRPQPGCLHPPLPGRVAQLVDRILLPHGTCCAPAVTRSRDPGGNRGPLPDRLVAVVRLIGAVVQVGHCTKAWPSRTLLSRVWPGAAPIRVGHSGLPPGLFTTLMRTI